MPEIKRKRSFVAPFSQTNSVIKDVVGDKKKAIDNKQSSLNNKSGASLLQLGRVQTVTPKTRKKIKERFAQGLKSQYDGHFANDTSPGFYVPFDVKLTQSQCEEVPCSGIIQSQCQESPCSLASQLELGVESTEASKMDATGDYHGDNASYTAGVHTGTTYSTFDYTSDNEEDDVQLLLKPNKVKQHNRKNMALAAKPKVTTKKLNKRENQHSKDITAENGKTLNAKQTPSKPSSKPKRKKAHIADVTSLSTDENRVSQKKVANVKKRCKGSRRNKSVEEAIKQAVLTSLFKMHSEIMELQKRRSQINLDTVLCSLPEEE